jgi:RNA polymerase sigma-70 factor, ECF subfamily
MQAYAAGDMEAFEALYRQHKNRIFGFLMARLKNQAEAEEVFQTIFTKLHVARNRYRQEIPFLPWIFTIARNALIDHIRKKTTYRKHITLSDVAIESHAVPEDDDSDAGGIFEKMSRLTESQRRAIELRFTQGLTFQEIAKQMQTSPDNSRQIISRAIRKLRKLMTRKEISRESN